MVDNSSTRDPWKRNLVSRRIEVCYLGAKRELELCFISWVTGYKMFAPSQKIWSEKQLMELPVSPSTRCVYFNDTAAESVLLSQCCRVSAVSQFFRPVSLQVHTALKTSLVYQLGTNLSQLHQPEATVLSRCHDPPAPPPTRPPHPANSPSGLPQIFTAMRLPSVRECRSPSHQCAGVWPQLQMCDSLRRGKHNKADLWLSFIWGSYEKSWWGGLRRQGGWVLICLVNSLSCRPDFGKKKTKQKITDVDAVLI